MGVKEGFGLHAKAQDYWRMFAAHYVFATDFCNIASGNEKGLVENLVGYGRNNFLVPVPKVESMDALNTMLLEACLQYRNNHSVGRLETWLVGMIRNQRFFSFHELNRYIRERLAELVRRPFQKREGSRYSVFCEVDQPALRPLPVRAFEIADMVVRRVPNHYHVEYKGFCYSVPYTLFRQQVTLRASERTIEIFDKDRNRVATHVRKHQGRRYITVSQHMPENHRAFQQQQAFDGDGYRRWANLHLHL